MWKSYRDLRRRAVACLQERDRFDEETRRTATLLEEKAALAELRGQPEFAHELLAERDCYLREMEAVRRRLEDAIAGVKEEIWREQERLRRGQDDRYLPKPLAVALLTLYAVLAAVTVLRVLVD